MTAPVNQEKENGKWVISFVMPLDYTLETLPEPLDPSVNLKIVLGRLVAVSSTPELGAEFATTRNRISW